MSKAEDPLVDCPLERSHRIRKSRLQFHLVRCLKNYALDSSTKVKCPYNPLHIVEAIEIMHHCRTCFDSASVVLKQFDLEGEKCFSGDIPLEEFVKRYDEIIPRTSEKEQPIFTGPGYDPTQNIEDKMVYRSICCEPKLKRKEFIKRERERFAALEMKNKLPLKTKVSNVEKPQQPLRQPHNLSESIKKVIEKSNSEEFVVNNQQHFKNNENQISIEKLVPENILKNKENVNPSPIKNGNNEIVNNASTSKQRLIELNTNLTIKDSNKVDVESVTGALDQLDMSTKSKNFIKEYQLTTFESKNGKEQNENTFSYRDAILSKTNATNAKINDENLPKFRTTQKLAANFNMRQSTTEAD